MKNPTRRVAVIVMTLMATPSVKPQRALIVGVPLLLVALTIRTKKLFESFEMSNTSDRLMVKLSQLPIKIEGDNTIYTANYYYANKHEIDKYR